MRPASLLLALLLLWPSPSARADLVLPASAQAELLNAIAPFAPGEPLVEPWHLGDVRLTQRQIDLQLVAGEEKRTLRLLPRGDAPDAKLKTKSFALRLVGEGPETPELRLSVEALHTKLLASDRGSFYRQVDEKRTDPRKPDPGIDILLWLAILLLVAGALAMAPKGPFRGPNFGDEAWRTDLPIALALVAVAYLLRTNLGPMTLLHENAHGVHLLEQVADLSFVERPMAGQVGLGRFFAFFSSPSIEALTLGTALLASLQAALSYGIGRSFGLKRPAAAAAALLVATLPVLVRMTASEDAFGPATTFAMSGAWCAIRAGQTGSGPKLAAALIFVAIAGHFRPVFYTAALPLGSAVFFFSPPGQAKAWLRRPWLYVAGLIFVGGIADDLGGLLSRLAEGSPMTPGWWQGASIRSWPLWDPASTPVWYMPLVLVGGALAWKAGRKREVLWLSLVGAWLTFVYTSDNAWPASLRYAVAYAWVGALMVGLGLGSLGTVLRPSFSRGAWLFVLLCALSAPVTHYAFIGHRFAQQQELDFQREEVLPVLLEQKDAKVITPWGELGHMSGTLITAPLKLHGVHVLGIPEAEGVRFERRLYWYRGLACWAKRDSDVAEDTSKMRRACRRLEAAHAWKHVARRTLKPDSDSDWIQLGDGLSSIEVGLFVRELEGL